MWRVLPGLWRMSYVMRVIWFVTSVTRDAVISLAHQLNKSSNQQHSVLLSMSGQLDGYLREMKLYIYKLVLYGTEGLFGCRTFQ